MPQFNSPEEYQKWKSDKIKELEQKKERENFKKANKKNIGEIIVRILNDKKLMLPILLFLVIVGIIF